MAIDTPANARSRRTRDALLGAARAILENAGAEQLTMAAVAERAGVTRRAVYLHFPHRTELVFALVGYVAEQENLEESLRPVVEAPDAITALDAWCRHLAQYGLRLVPVLRAIERAPDSDVDVARYREKIVSSQRETCRNLITRLADEGRLAAPWTVETATDMLWALGGVLRGLLVERDWPEQRYMEHMSVLLRSTFVAGREDD